MIVYGVAEVVGFIPQGCIEWTDCDGEHTTGWMDLEGPLPSPYEAARFIVEARKPYSKQHWSYRIVRRQEEVVQVLDELPPGSAS